MPNVLHNTLLRASVETVVWVIDGGAHVVSLRNYTGGCKYEISVNGSIQRDGFAKGKRPRRKIKLADGREGAVFTTPVSGSTYEYELQLEGSVIPRDIEGIWSPDGELYPDLDQCVSVPTVRLGDTSDGEGMEGVALYKVLLEPRVPGKFERRAEWKRYNDFDELYTLVISAHFRKEVQHLASSVPKPPGKTWRRQTGTEYIERRRSELEHFLQALCRSPRMAHNPDLLNFLGIFDGQVNRIGVTEGPQLLARRTALEPEPEGSGNSHAIGLPSNVIACLEDCTADSTEIASHASVESLVRLAMRSEGSALVGWLVERLSAGLEDSQSTVIVKTLKLLTALVPKGSQAFRGTLKAECGALLLRAQSYDCDDPTYGDKPAKMVRKLSMGLHGLLLGDERVAVSVSTQPQQKPMPPRIAAPETTAKLPGSQSSDSDEPLFGDSQSEHRQSKSDDAEDCL